MATSSIFANVRITDPQEAEAFAEALDASAQESERMSAAPMIPLVTNIEEMRKFMAAGKELVIRKTDGGEILSE